MQSGRSRAGVTYRYRRASDDDEEPQARPQTAEDEAEESSELVEAAGPGPASSSASSSGSGSSGGGGFEQVVGAACASALGSITGRPALAAGAAIGLAAVGLAVGLLRGRQRQPPAGSSSRRGGGAAAGAGSGKAAGGNKGKAGGKAASAPAAPGPNAKVKPRPDCVPLADGSAVVVRRPIAADNSCLFNAVGYCMHHSRNRAPFLRQVVSREVSSDPQAYHAAFLGMENAAYCAWITNPTTWGGGIELAILAAHYRREIAAWNLASGACHVFGEESGYTKRVMLIYNGSHYDALALAAAPRADGDEDVTEFNPRSKRGKAIMAAAGQLVQLSRKEPNHQPEQPQKQARGEAAAAAGSSSSEPPPSAAAAPQGGGAGRAVAALLACGSCGEQLAGVEAAKAHAAATGHSEFAEVAAGAGA